MMRKILKSKKPYVKQKYILQKSLNKILLISSIFIAISCSILPEGYEENLTSGTWVNVETLTVGTVTSQSTFSTDGIYDKVVISPGGTVTQKFFYETGYYVSKYAIILYEYSDNIGANPPVVGTPIYYRFTNDFNTLITSTNANMSLSQTWLK